MFSSAFIEITVKLLLLLFVVLFSVKVVGGWRVRRVLCVCGFASGDVDNGEEGIIEARTFCGGGHKS